MIEYLVYFVYAWFHSCLDIARSPEGGMSSASGELYNSVEELVKLWRTVNAHRPNQMVRVTQPLSAGANDARFARGEDQFQERDMQ